MVGRNVFEEAMGNGTRVEMGNVLGIRYLERKGKGRRLRRWVWERLRLIRFRSGPSELLFSLHLLLLFVALFPPLLVRLFSRFFFFFSFKKISLMETGSYVCSKSRVCLFFSSLFSKRFHCSFFHFPSSSILVYTLVSCSLTCLGC